MRYLEQQLRARTLAGKAISLAGISIGALSMIMPMPSTAQEPSAMPESADGNVAISHPIERTVIKGRVLGVTSDNGNAPERCDTLLGALVFNLNTEKSVAADIDGCFEIEACRGDSIKASFVGYETQTIAVTDNSAFLNITLKTSSTLMGEALVLGGAIAAPRDRENMLDLHIVADSGKPVDLYDIYIGRIFLDEDGEEDWEDLSPTVIEEKHLLRLYWNDDWGLNDESGKPLKKATLRIEAEGYEDAVIEVKYPKRNTKKTVKLKPLKE